MLPRSRRSELAAWWVALFVGLASVATSARAQPVADASADDLAAARAVFAEALRDEEAKHFVDALQKLLRVRAVRDTAPVEYRIGACHEGLAQSVAAYNAYRQAVALGQDDARTADVVRAARDRMQALNPRVARLVLALPSLAPADAEVRVDDRIIARASLREPIVLEPGPHVVTATAREAVPSRSEIVLPEGAQVSLTVPLASQAGAPPPQVETAAAPAEANRPADASTTAVPANGTARTAGWIIGGVGGGLLVASAVLLFARKTDIDRLNTACPGGTCPQGSNEAALESTRSRALLEGPLALLLGAAGAMAVGTCAYLLWTSQHAPHAHASAHVELVLGPGAGGVAIAGQFR